MTDDSQKAEADYKKELEDAGVEIPVNDSAESPKVEETPKEPKVETPEEPEKKEDIEPRVERKRSIYDDLKEKKHDLKDERIAREQAERERDELKRQLEEVSQANSPDARTATPTGLLEFAEEKGADPELVKRIVEEARNGQQSIDPELKGRLEQFDRWQKQNASVIEKQMFDDEFNKTVPTLKEMFPNANTEELGALKSELDKLSHSKEMHDKELEYVAFKNREHLSAFVSPRKVGMESKGRNQVGDTPSEFNPNADLTKMSAKELDAWETSYRKMGAEQGGITGTGKNKIIL